MRVLKIALAAIGILIATFVAESYLGSSRYQLNGITYSVPHKYEFTRTFNLPWLAKVQGLDKEPDESVWLMFSAQELTQGIPGYKRLFHGYSDQVEADMVINVLGGKEAREFPGDRSEDMQKVARELADKRPTRPDPWQDWTRVYWSLGEKGTPGEGNDLFYIIPASGLDRLPSNWRVPSCQSAPDIKGRETYDCSITIYQDGLTFDFYIRSEDLPVANRIPSYTLARLATWRD